SDFINDLYIDLSGIIWIGQMQPALSKLYYQKSKFITYNLFKQNEQYVSREIRSVNQSSNPDKLWISTNGSGLFLFDTKTNKIIQFTDQTKRGLQLPGNKMNFCYQDRQGNLWMVFQRLGLYVVPKDMVENLLFGKMNPAIKPFDANRLANKESEANSYILSLYMDRSERLWAGGWGSLHMIDLKGNLISQYATNDKLTEINSTCVFSFDSYDEEKVAFAPVASIVELKKDLLLLGTLGSGLVEVETTSSGRFIFRRPGVNNSMSTRNVIQVYKDKQNNIWMGTHAGLYCWNTSNDSLKLITAAKGLCSDDINNIIQDDNANIWVSTSYGISKILSLDFSITNFYYTDKDKFNQYIINAAVHTSDNLIGFSTNEAMVFIHPDSVERDHGDPPLYFTDIKIDNKPVIPLEKYFGTRIINAGINDCKVIRVPHNHTLSIEFAALDFMNSGKLMYKYRLGSNADWVVLNASQRSLVIPKLRSGEYPLSIMLADSHEQQMRTIIIDYLPPFWLTLPAYFVYFLLVLGVLFLYRRALIRKVLQKSILEKERFERRKIEELDKMKTEFFSNISHELRTPLSLIINPLEAMARDKDLPAATTEKVKLALKSSNRLLKLTNELIDFSKIENERLKPDFQRCEIVSLVNETCQLFNNMAETMNLDFKTISSFEQLEIPIDKGMVEKVIFNLLSNAFKFTPANGMVMVNLTRSQHANIEHVKLSVINTGEGISHDDLGKIFDRYYQVNHGSNSPVQGTGIGLALVKSFIGMHHGIVEVKSEPNLETSFDVYLPLKQPGFDDLINTGTVEPVHNKEIIQPVENKTHTARAENRHRLLLVEDEQDIRNYIKNELSAEFEIAVAADGEEGLKKAGEIIPDLIITDVKMPVLSGLELCKILKNQVITSHIPVIMLSAKASVEEQIEGLETGADVYMVKPFSIDHLKAQIISLISFKQAVYQKNLKETSLIPQDAMPGKLDAEFLQKITAFIEANLTDSNLSVDQLAQCVSLSKVQTYRKIKAISGLSIVEFIRTIRLKKAAQLILENRQTFSEISFETGFSTPSYFSKCFHDHFGQTPSEFAASNSGR
ncbi:MAG: response regulator, partial [Bacteroidales bacterium]|nr:response regulator [Bacteroidales bacterium]